MLRPLGIFAVLFNLASCDQRSGEIVQERLSPDQQIKAIRLVPQGEINLMPSEHAKLAGVTGIFVLDSSIVVIDELIKRVFLYDKSGNFVRQVGSSGKRPGEFLNPFPQSSSVDFSNHIYIYDSERGIVNVFDGTGTFVAEWNRDRALGAIEKILVGKDGNIFILTDTSDGEMGIARLVKYNRQFKRIFSTPLSDWETDSIDIHMSSGYSGFSYNRTLERIYYLLPTEYRIKEIDTRTGGIVREFGEKPNAYRPLDRKYHRLGYISFDQMEGIMSETTFLYGSTFLLDDKYLVVGHGNHNMRLSWLVYDVTSFDKVYSLDDESEQILDRTRSREFPRRVVSTCILFLLTECEF